MDITIYPKKLKGQMQAIPSKSQAHRVLICAALSDNATTILCPDTNRDIEATVSCLRNLGAVIEKNGSVYSVTPIDIPCKNAEIDCGESGSTLRFLLPVICALGSETVINASGRLPERPLSPLKEELIRMGAKISDSFPLAVSGRLSAGGSEMKGDVSSQFVTGLLMALAFLGGGKINLLPPVQSRPYIDITLEVLRTFGADIKEDNNTFYIDSNQTQQDATTVAQTTMQYEIEFKRNSAVVKQEKVYVLVDAYASEYQSGVFVESDTITEVWMSLKKIRSANITVPKDADSYQHVY